LHDEFFKLDLAKITPCRCGYVTQMREAQVTPGGTTMDWKKKGMEKATKARKKISV
jgi:hypothetical protein